MFNKILKIFGLGKVTSGRDDFEKAVVETGAVIVPMTAFLSNSMKTPILVPNSSFLISLRYATAVPSPQKTEVKKMGNDYYFIDNDGFMQKTTVSA